MAESVSPSDISSIHTGTDNLSPIEGVISMEDIERQTTRLLTLFMNKSVCVLHDERKWQHTAEKIITWFEERKVEAVQINYTQQGWIETVKTGQYTKFIFLGLPPCDRKRKGPLRIMRPARSPTASDYSQMEYNYFTPSVLTGGNSMMTVNNVVLVVRDPINTKKDFKNRINGHYLESYMILDGKKDPGVISALALGVFAAPTPTPLASDKAYWSEFPKLIVDFRPKTDVSLGLIIMTRQMAEGAPFPRIVLVNSVSQDHYYDFYSKVGRYTHIQSINGILLDGMSIEKVTDIFKRLPYCHIQLLVRYVHLNETVKEKAITPHPSPLREFPKRLSTMSISPSADPGSGKGTTTKQHKQAQSDSQVLPIPLFLLGDNHTLCKELFTVLSSDTPSSPAVFRPSRFSDISRPNGTTPTHDVAPPQYTKRSVSVPGPPNYTSDLFKSSSIDVIDEGVASSSSDPEIPVATDVRRRSKSFKGISASDSFMIRAEMPLSKLENLPPPFHSDSVRPSQATPTTPSGLNPRDNLLVLHKQQYILHLPSQDLDRQATHLYFKTSGIYLVVVDLEDLIEFPLIQYENLFYWINMIHTYVTPELKRMFVVGMYKRSKVTIERLFEGLKVINNILKNYRQAVRIPMEEQGYVYLYDRERSEDECKHLCRSIVNCSTLFCDSSFYFAEEVYKSVFDPFTGFLKIATDLSLNNDRAIMETKYSMGQRFKALYGNHQHLHLPKGFFESLAAFSPACISKHCDACLLTPAIIPDLLNACSQLSKYATQIFDVDPALFNLPIVSVQMLRRCFEDIQPNHKADFDMIIWWMLDLSLIYAIGSLREDEKFFIPYLLHHNMSDRTTYNWDEDKIELMFTDTTILYTQFSSHVPLTVHLFHKVVSQFLSCILRDGFHREVFIHPDSPEAVLPLYDDNTDEFVCDTWIRYRPIQNIIEFRAKVTNRIRFLKVVEHRLSKAFLGTKYYNKAIDFNRVVTFRIPSSEGFNASTVQPSDLLELAKLEAFEDTRNELLVPTQHLTEPGNRKKTAIMRRWADKDPEAKQLPAELSLKISDRLSINNDWAKLGSRLNILTAEEIHIRSHNFTGNNGTYILQKWTDSKCSFIDLINALKDLHLESYASQVETILYGEGDSSASFVPSSKFMEKKLPTDFFLELARALNSEDKWAMLGSHLRLLSVQDIESLKAKPLVDKGSHVLQLWTDSHLTYQDLLNALNHPSVRMNKYSFHIEALIKNHLSSS